VEYCVALSTKAEKVHSHDVSEIWHKRLGYLHHGSLNIMQKITSRLPKGSLEQHDVYKGCTLGKYVKSTFHDQDNKAYAVLERVHSDVCGPYSTTSTSKHKYFVIFIDYFSRKCWIFFMHKKDETFSKFVEFKELVKKETNKKVKALKSDNGDEYASNDFKDL